MTKTVSEKRAEIVDILTASPRVRDVAMLGNMTIRVYLKDGQSIVLRVSADY